MGNFPVDGPCLPVIVKKNRLQTDWHVGCNYDACGKHLLSLDEALLIDVDRLFQSRRSWK
ncbi:MAG: hypothetical protein ACI8W3_003751 [Myxococcota bacterium]|jgi:hypothetical protein